MKHLIVTGVVLHYGWALMHSGEHSGMNRQEYKSALGKHGQLIWKTERSKIEGSKIQKLRTFEILAVLKVW